MFVCLLFVFHILPHEWGNGCVSYLRGSGEMLSKLESAVEERPRDLLEL